MVRPVHFPLHEVSKSSRITSSNKNILILVLVTRYESTTNMDIFTTPHGPISGHEVVIPIR